MAHLAFRSFTTFGYFGAVLLIAIVAVLALTSFGDDSSGPQALATATPAPAPVSAGPRDDVWIDRDCAQDAATHVYSGAGVLVQEAAGNETPVCSLTLD